MPYVAAELKVFLEVSPPVSCHVLGTLWSEAAVGVQWVVEKMDISRLVL